MMQKLRALFGLSFKDEKSRPGAGGRSEATRDPAKEPGQPPKEADRGDPPRREGTDQTGTQDESPRQSGQA